MKYIRTKDGIEKLDTDREYLAEYMNGNKADTIEELVDEYVCVMPSGETFLLDKNTDLKAQVNYIGDVYGSIWVGADLLSKAKVNKEGELELL